MKFVIQPLTRSALNNFTPRKSDLPKFNIVDLSLFIDKGLAIQQFETGEILAIGGLMYSDSPDMIAFSFVSEHLDSRPMAMIKCAKYTVQVLKDMYEFETIRAQGNARWLKLVGVEPLQ